MGHDGRLCVGGACVQLSGTMIYQLGSHDRRALPQPEQSSTVRAHLALTFTHLRRFQPPRGLSALQVSLLLNPPHPLGPQRNCLSSFIQYENVREAWGYRFVHLNDLIVCVSLPICLDYIFFWGGEAIILVSGGVGRVREY